MVCHLVYINLFPMFHYIVLNIIYICLCAWFVVIIYVYYLYGEDKSKSCDNFLFNPTSFFICNEIILNLTNDSPHTFVLIIIYICLCAWFVVISVCVLFVWRGLSISCDNFVFNSIALLFAIK